MSNSGLQTISFLLDDIIMGIETSGKIDSLRKSKIKELELQIKDFVNYNFNFNANVLTQLKEIKYTIDRLKERKTSVGTVPQDSTMVGTRINRR